MLKIGCRGFPVARERYFSRFPVVEVSSTFLALPGPETVERWRGEAPEGFEFSLQAWQPITFPLSPGSMTRRLRPQPEPKRILRYGHFRGTDEVHEAWSRFEEVARALEPSFIVFETPPTFHPNADHLRDMYRFFKRIRRGKSVLVWEPRGSAFDDALIGRICADLGLNHGVDPFDRESRRGDVRYFRPRRPRTEGGFGEGCPDGRLRELLSRCEGKTTYVFFDGRAMWRDAQRFSELADGVEKGMRPQHRGGRVRPPRCWERA